MRHWRACADALSNDAGNSDGRLMAALVLRHMAELAEYLEEGLQLDPDDRDAYLQKDYHQ